MVARDDEHIHVEVIDDLNQLTHQNTLYKLHLAADLLVRALEAKTILLEQPTHLLCMLGVLPYPRLLLHVRWPHCQIERRVHITAKKKKPCVR